MKIVPSTLYLGLSISLLLSSSCMAMDTAMDIDFSGAETEQTAGSPTVRQIEVTPPPAGAGIPTASTVSSSDKGKTEETVESMQMVRRDGSGDRKGSDIDAQTNASSLSLDSTPTGSNQKIIWVSLRDPLVRRVFLFLGRESYKFARTSISINRALGGRSFRNLFNELGRVFQRTDEAEPGRSLDDPFVRNLCANAMRQDFFWRALYEDRFPHQLFKGKTPQETQDNLRAFEEDIDQLPCPIYPDKRFGRALDFYRPRDMLPTLRDRLNVMPIRHHVAVAILLRDHRLLTTHLFFRFFKDMSMRTLSDIAVVNAVLATPDWKEDRSYFMDEHTDGIYPLFFNTGLRILDKHPEKAAEFIDQCAERRDPTSQLGQIARFTRANSLAHGHYHSIDAAVARDELNSLCKLDNERALERRLDGLFKGASPFDQNLDEAEEELERCIAQSKHKATFVDYKEDLEKQKKPAAEESKLEKS